MKWKIRWLACALLIITLVTGVTYSRYITTVTGTGSAEVARIEMSGQMTNSETSLDLSNLKPGETKIIQFSVVNYSGTDQRVSDVAQQYSIEVISTGNLPLTFELKSEAVTDPQGKAAEPWSGALTGGTPIKTAANGEFPHSTKSTHTYTLTVKWPKDKNSVQYTDEVDMVTLYVESKQKIS